MGGPCFIVIDGKTRNNKVKGPNATDNFQIIDFTFPPGSDQTYYSAEQCYQAQKFSDERHISALREAVPFGGETDSAYGMRVWSLGQKFCSLKSNWEDIRVEVMYLVNCAKYLVIQHYKKNY